MDKQSPDLVTKAKIENLIQNMLDCLLYKEGRKCNRCKCVDACSYLTEAVFVCRNRNIEKHESCF
jgi:hypothetical protein